MCSKIIGIKHRPNIFFINWFRKNAKGDFIWPGFSENIRVLKWIIERCQDKVRATETPVGLLPQKKDFALEGLNMSDKDWDDLFSLDKGAWEQEINDIEAFYGEFGKKLPAALKKELKKLKSGISKLG